VHQTVSTYSYDALHIQDPEKHYSASVQFYQGNFLSIEEEVCRGGSILDVGCGTGRLLELLSKHESVYRAGIELNAERAAMARRIARCDIHELPVESFSPARRFDAVTLINVLSHIPSFDTLFPALRALLSPRGRLILKVGECSGKVKKSAMFDWSIPDHLHFLGLGTLSFLCRKYGFRIVRHDRTPLAQNLFTRSRWRSPGRSGVRDAVKAIVASTPFALQTVAAVYRAIHDDSIYSSFVVLTPQESG
jgi:SAM-dependent methyltransferase